MVKNISQYNKNTEAEIEESVGIKLNFWEKIMLKGAISEKFLISKSSPNISKHLLKIHNINFCFIERRKNGIIVNFTSILNEYAWVIPFSELQIKKIGNTYEIISDTEEIRLSPKLLNKNHQSFLDRIMADQQRYLKNSA